MTASRPVVGIPASVMTMRHFPMHIVGHSNAAAVARVAQCHPMVIPALGGDLDVADIVGHLDGLLLTGGASNIEPHHYEGPPARDGDLHDPHRDSSSLPLIRAALDAGVPVFAICRGFQEFNVALGGTLHQFLHEIPGRIDHRRDRTKPMEAQMGHCHDISLRPDGLLQSLAGSDTAGVNSLHGQGIDRPAPGTTVEATAPDTTIEALSVNAARAFAVGVQWHPEFRAEEDPFYRALFEAFGDAARARTEQRRGVAR
ncbi:MAG: gamma-glutamyl-gamma-aminobutyrate hydrolase family protein [Proteobacteria bacterium]|nr:gamma-glutamyl-gamma-aminobutyrate hydrolase family protein [Pseudomonadota bacterium]MDA1057890.1 gamma-glutamyl-gamma-aminobutyrate hydrolase family protein [Pseudomonadota bacterium]